MKQILLVAILFLTINTYGQTVSSKTDVTKISDIKFNAAKIYNTREKTENDTLPGVTYVNENNTERNPAYFINEKFVNATILKTLNPNIIDGIKVVNEDVEIDHIKYYGQIHLKTKDNYNQRLISLNDIKLKYTNLKNSPALFVIDNEIINADYGKYLVDENYVLKISVEKIENKEDKLKINIVKVLTKSADNIQKSKEIRIRGTHIETTFNE